VAGITADVTRCRIYAERTASLVTALAPAIGYDQAAAIFKRAVADDSSIRQAVLDAGLLDEARLDEILDIEKLTRGNRA